MVAKHVLRTLLLTGGFLFLLLAVIGTLLPVMPTVPFLLLSMACFSRSSERMHQWILNWPAVGPELRAWEEQGAVSKKAKVWSTVVLLGLGAVPMLLRDIAVWMKITSVLIVLAIIVFLLTRPLPREAPTDGD
ncbi:MAG: YbaN family protein [Planctomycetota bacterium]